MDKDEFLLRYKHFINNTMKNTHGVLVCLTSGVDSTLVLAATVKTLHKKVMAITFTSPLQSKRSIKKAREIARMLQVPHISYNYYPLSCKEIRYNKPARCYICKARMFSLARKIAQQKDLTDIFDGTHADDREENRPGMRALREYAIKSPLKELGLSKAAIRSLAHAMGLANWNLKADSCFATKFPVGTKLWAKELRKLEAN
ncbi:MAG: asparagine synthase-related protein [bacterium]